MCIFQINMERVISVNSQAVNLDQSEQKLHAQISKPPSVLIPSSEEIHRAIKSVLRNLPSSTGCCSITADFN